MPPPTPPMGMPLFSCSKQVAANAAEALESIDGVRVGAVGAPIIRTGAEAWVRSVTPTLGYVFDEASVLAADGLNVVRPLDRTALQPGRWILFASGGSADATSYGEIGFFDLGTGYTDTYVSGTGRLLVPVTAQGLNQDFDMPTPGTLRYIGAQTKRFSIHGQALIDWTSTNGVATTRGFFVQIARNGVVIPQSTWLNDLIVNPNDEPKMFHCETFVSLAQNQFLNLFIDDGGVAGNTEGIRSNIMQLQATQL